MEHIDDLDNVSTQMASFGPMDLGITWKRKSLPDETSDIPLNISTSTIEGYSAKELEEAKKKAYEEGYKKGYEEGRADGLNQAYEVARCSFDEGANKLYSMGRTHERELVEKKGFLLGKYAEEIGIDEMNEPPTKRIKLEDDCMDD